MFSPSLFLFSVICINLNLVFTCSSSPSDLSSIHSCHKDEQSALLHFKESLAPTSKTRSWKNDTDCCEWEGITCDPVTRHIIALDLFWSGIVGTIHSNSSLFKLHHLQSLNLARNDLSPSTLSPNFGQLRFLKHLDLSENYFFGSVPLEIAQLCHLEFLDLSNNGDLKMPNFNRIVGNLTKLRVLNLTYVSLVSQISQFISNVSSLEYLDLGSCDLQGELPSNILNLPNLKLLDVSWNDGSFFKFPSSYNSSSPLGTLDLSYVNISSELPSYLGQLQQLTFLSLTGCNLHGTIPVDTTKLSSLTYLYLGRNLLVGEVPAELFKLESLIIMNLEDNKFGGSINLYDIVSNLPNLYYLMISNSGLSVTIDGSPNFTSTFANNLAVLQLSNSSLGGEIPQWFFQAWNTSLVELDLSHNSLIEEWKSFPWSRLGSLDISYNMFHGCIPELPPHIGWFSASSNKFRGPISSSICGLTSLYGLDLSNNNFSDEIPPCLGTNSSFGLSVLSLGSNNIHGSLVWNFSECSFLTFLDLSDNQLQGLLPQSLAGCTSLQAINLGRNNFTGKFPHWLHTLPQIQVLDLSSNSFHGHITNISEELQYPMLEVINLSNNYFSGPIPPAYIKSFKAMMNTSPYFGSPQYLNSSTLFGNDYYFSMVMTFNGAERSYTKIITTLTNFDLSSNTFEGDIPECIGQLISMHGLNLSHNQLTGSIPPSISKLTLLNGLDLSNNMLSGQIPQELTSLTSMGVFIVSENHLKGPIPHGNNFDTFPTDSYEGNPNLCGFPLPECKEAVSSDPPTSKSENSEVPDGIVLPEWKVIMMGCGCGSIVGMAWGYYMLSGGKPFWFAKMAYVIELTIVEFFEEWFGRRTTRRTHRPN